MMILTTMPVQHLHQLRHPRRNVRLDTLTRLRWLAIVGQTAAVLVVNYGLDVDCRWPRAPP